MSVENKLMKILEQFEDSGTTIEIMVSGEYEEVDLENEINKCFSNFNISEYDYSIDIMFENLGITVYSVSIVWIENGKMNHILNYEIDLI